MTETFVIGPKIEYNPDNTVDVPQHTQFGDFTSGNCDGDGINVLFSSVTGVCLVAVVVAAAAAVGVGVGVDVGVDGGYSTSLFCVC